VKRSDIDSGEFQRLPRQADPVPDPALGSAASGHPEEWRALHPQSRSCAYPLGQAQMKNHPLNAGWMGLDFPILVKRLGKDERKIWRSPTRCRTDV